MGLWERIKTLERVARRCLRGQPVICLKYPVHPRPRYGYGRPAHGPTRDLLEGKRDHFAQTLRRFVPLADRIAEIPRHSTGPADPHWDNPWLTGLDAVALYGLVTLERPRQFMEVGSGMSTTFVRRAIRDHDLATTITSIDPQPRVEIDSICDTVIRSPLEQTDLSVFDVLEPGDILYLDGSHVALQNSDATVQFLDVLPRLPAGVLVHIHDIFLPDDYPPQWADRYYAEQYLLATYMLGRGSAMDIVLANHFICQDPGLSGIMTPLFERENLTGKPMVGCSFWYRTGDPSP